LQQQAEIALPPTSSAEPDGRSAIKKLAQLDAAWLASQLDAAWLTVLLCYCAVFGGILIYSDFLPYTFDNNESFSAFWHARNMYEYGIANSSGLADESFSYDAAAHPYVYTHAGASPRLFAYLLYVLGIRTIEVQIAVTVFTVGLLAFWFAYRFLAEISTRLYATIACLLLMTDYIMFTQWHVGAWHVWKMLLLFGGLYLAQRIAARKQAYSLLVVYAFHAFLFYYETIFNVYVAAAVFLYFVFASRDYRFVVKFGLAQFAGALTAAAVLLGQLVLQFGWDVVRTDIYYTFIGRNFATDSAAFLEAARAFYAEHNIVFWLNVPDIDPYRNLLWAFRSLFQDHAVHTPPWSLIVLAFAAAEIIRRLRSRRGTLFNLSARMSARPNRAFANVDWKLVVKDTTVLALPILAILSALTFCILSTYPEIGAGLAPPPSFWIFVVWSLVIAAAIVAIAVLSRARPGLGALPIVPELARPRDLFDRIDWELVSKDATVLAKFLLAALTIAILYVLADLAPPWLFWTLAAAVIGIGILAAAALDRRSLQARALPRVRMFFNAIDWKMVIKDATVLAPFMLLALVMPPLIGVGIVAAAIVFRHPLQERALPRLSKFFARVVWNWPVKDEWKRPLPLYFRSFTIPRLTPLSQRTLFADPGRIFGASAFIAAVLAFLLVQPSLYAGTAASLSQHSPDARVPKRMLPCRSLPW
jgi:hypothetical protein